VVQAGAFSTQVDAEARRAELGFLGFEARVIPRTDGAKTLYRVRLGPYGTAQEANDVKSKLQANSITATVGRVK
ncbi:MAG: SPOR domain-containing protein, partial [Parasutterella excrementihominis]